MSLTQASAVLSLLGVASVSVQVQPDALCVDQVELAQSLADLPNPRRGRVTVSLSGPRELLVRAMWADGQSLERRIPGNPTDCPAVRRVVVALTRAWFSAPPKPVERPKTGAVAIPIVSGAGTSAPAAEAAEKAAGTKAAGTEAAGTSATGTSATGTSAAGTKAAGTKPAGTKAAGTKAGGTIASGTSATGASASGATGTGTSATGPTTHRAPGTATTSATSVRSPSSTTSGAADSGLSTSAELGPVPALPPSSSTATAAAPALSRERAGSPELTASAATASPPPQWGFGVGALAGTTAGTTPEAVAAGSFFLELTRAHFGLGLEGGLESARSLTRLEGRAWAVQRWLTLYGKVGVPLSPRLSLAATVGFRGWQLEVGAVGTATGFSNTSSKGLLGYGAALTVGAELELGPVVLHVRGVGALRSREERLIVTDFGSVLLLKWWQVGALAGLGWRFP